MYPVLDADGRSSDRWVRRVYGTGQVVFTPTGFGLFGGWWGEHGIRGMAAAEERIAHSPETRFARVNIP